MIGEIEAARLTAAVSMISAAAKPLAALSQVTRFSGLGEGPETRADSTNGS
jgi:hypothetical protein